LRLVLDDVGSAATAFFISCAALRCFKTGERAGVSKSR
jgi:hypothetical protein